jgi:glutamate formiminotransferase / formiminotetrahydrofolate cyclodeaminase
LAKLVECVPNFSEGRRPEIIEAIVKEIKSVSGVLLLDKEMDKDHNRAVITFVGAPEEVKAAAFKAICRATELIDMEKHKGEHPRMGATDVVPFIPISGVSMQDCVILAKELGQEVGEKLGIPVYLYEAAATRPDRQNLAEVRRGEYEGIKKEIEINPDRKPDFGPSKIHPSAGVTAIGARMPLIAFNVYLGTKDVRVAKRTAKAIRHSDGGLRYVKALGFVIKERGIVQISMNLVNYLGSPIFRVFELIKSEAERYGVPIVGSEIVGLTPMEALIDVADFYLRLENFKKDQVLETKLMSISSEQKEGLVDFIDEVASSEPAPGGGSVAATAGALAGALTSMVCGLTIGKKKYLEVEEEIKEVLKKSENLRKELKELVIKDAESFEKVMDARKLSKHTETEGKRREEAIQEATKGAALVPLEVMEKSLEVLKLAKIVAEKGNENAVSDAGVSNLLAKAAIDGAGYNVRINLSSIKDEIFISEIKKKLDNLSQAATFLSEQIRVIVEGKL